MKKENGVYHKTFYCSEFYNCGDGDKIFDIFLLADMQYCSNDRGVSWINARLEDRSGCINAKVWSNRMEHEYNTYEGKIVLVSGRVSFYGGKPELSIDKMQTVSDDEFELSEVIKTLRKEKVKVYKEQILAKIEQIESENIRNYVSGILNDDVLDLMAELPVRLGGHHSYRGALLEHTCEVAISSYFYAKSTAAVREVKYDIDLIIAGALLHDIGSYVNYESEGYAFYIEGNNRLLGNTYAAHNLLKDARIKSLMYDGEGIDDTTFALLLHIIDSSHGTVLPATMEAMIVKKMNELSAETEIYEYTYTLNKYAYNNAEFVRSNQLKRDIARIRREK